MTLPRILVSSTCYDLADLRSSLQEAVRSLNYEPILSEKNDILFDPADHTHVACIKAVEECDLVILIISRRFGGPAVPQALELIKIEEDSSKNKDFYKNLKKGVVSITQLEILKAFENNIPVFTFIKEDLANMHVLYEQNKRKEIMPEIDFPGFEKRSTVPYIFEFFNYIRLKTNNNAYITYSDSSDLIIKLKKQLALYFRELLKKQRVAAELAEPPNYVHSKIVNHTSKERTEAFRQLFTQIDERDEIKILGTGVTNFLGLEDEVEEFLKKGNKIKILALI